LLNFVNSSSRGRDLNEKTQLKKKKREIIQLKRGSGASASPKLKNLLEARRGEKYPGIRKGKNPR